MPAALAPLTSSAVSSQSYGLIGTSSAPGFSNRLTPGASLSSLSSYNDDIAAMNEQNRRMWAATHGGSDAGFPVSSGGAVYAAAATNPAAFNTDLAEMSRQQAEMLRVQIAMQRENLMFTSISNILKTKHDTLKNIVSNIR